MEAISKHEPLYLKYRPQALNQLIGQDAVTRTLTNAINHNRLSHAYLFVGPRGTGKTSTARILAKSLNCTAKGKPTLEPCQTCSCCVEISNSSSPAVFEIDAASNNSVDDARILIERAPLKAVGGQYKIYIIDECHMLTKEAFNALLKTIEQPPPEVIFILATTEEHKVLPTIVSRCQRLIFRLIDQETLANHLAMVAKKEKIAIESDALRLIARLASGAVRDALGNLDQASLLVSDDKPITITDLLRLMGTLHEDILLDLSNKVLIRDGKGIIESVHMLLSEGRDPSILAKELSGHFLNLIKASFFANQPSCDQLATLIIGSNEYLQGLLQQAPKFQNQELCQIVEHLDKVEQTCRRSLQAAMHLEIGLLSICHRQDMLIMNDLANRVSYLETLINPETLSQNTIQPKHLPPAAPTPSAHIPPIVSKITSITKEQDLISQAPTHILEDGVAKIINEPVSSPETSKAFNQQDLKNNPQSAANDVLSIKEQENEEIIRLNTDIDHFWDQILEELQRRHLPTFSLASTHAFPVSFTEDFFTVGVFKENFQKMLETKSEYLKNACKTVTGLSLTVKIKVLENNQTRLPKDNMVKTISPSSKSPLEELTLSVYSTDEKITPLTELSSQTLASDKTQAREEKTSQERLRDIDSSSVKEAYKFFEGPGSRRINQL